MEDIVNKQGVANTGPVGALNVEVLPNGNGSNGMIRTKDLDIAKLVTSEQRLKEEKFLEHKEE